MNGRKRPCDRVAQKGGQARLARAYLARKSPSGDPGLIPTNSPHEKKCPEDLPGGWSRRDMLPQRGGPKGPGGVGQLFEAR